MQINFSQRLFIFFPGLLCLLAGCPAYGQLPAYVPVDNLEAWYGFNGNANDASANGLNGNEISVTPTADRTGDAEGAFFFNGSESEIVIPFDNAFNSFPFTVSLWCRLNADNDGGMLIQHYTNSSWNGWVMSVSGTNGPTQTISPGYMLQAPPNCNGVVSSAQCDTGINYTGNLYDQMWHMLTFTVDGDSGRFYVDGQLQTAQAWMGPAGSPNGNSDMRIGGTDMASSFHFHGSMDDVGLWSRALTTEEISTLFNTLPPVAGCTNTNGCNYSPQATVNDGSCEFDCAGCIDPCACNYNQNAAFNDGSCDYGCNMGMTFITVFHDVNGNGSFDSGERPMQYWPVHITELQKTIYTDVAGMILVPLPTGIAHYQLINSTTDWISTTPVEIQVEVPGGTQAFFGLQHATGQASAEAEELAGYYSYMHCERGLESGVYVRNNGGQTLHGSLTLTCDPQFLPTMPWSASVPPNVSGPGFAQWNIQNLEPWETNLLAFHIQGPGSSFDGQATNYILELELFNEQETAVYTNTLNSSRDIRCDEQPSKLHSDPLGVDDAFHYVPDGSTITFRAQFQNNTQEWAEDVLIVQNLNSQQFDVGSFELLYASESMVGCLHDDGTIDLQFSNLVVAPVSEDPTQAGGYAVYRARLHTEITPDSTFYHNMHVVYDLNNTASTDTVFHTIYDCSRLANVLGDDTYCEGDTVVLQSQGLWIEEYRWLLGDSLLSAEPQFNMVLDPGFYNVVCQFTNPVCYVCEHKPIQVMDAPEGELFIQGNQITSVGDFDCQWHFNSEPIEGATQSSIQMEHEGGYQVQWTNQHGCQAWSQEFFLSSLQEQPLTALVYPNPAKSTVKIDLLPGNYSLRVYNPNGQIVLEEPNFTPNKSIDVSGLKPGVYYFKVESAHHTMRGVVCVD